MKHRILVILTLGSLIFISSCTINIVQAPVSSDAGKSTVKPEPLTSPSPTLPQLSTESDFLEDLDKTQGVSTLCEPFEFPELEDVPQFPYVPPDKRGDDEYVSALLIEHLDTLNEYIERIDLLIRTKYNEYLEECY